MMNITETWKPQQAEGRSRAGRRLLADDPAPPESPLAETDALLGPHAPLLVCPSSGNVSCSQKLKFVSQHV